MEHETDTYNDSSLKQSLNKSESQKKGTGLGGQYKNGYLYSYVFTVALGGFFIGIRCCNVRVQS